MKKVQAIVGLKLQNCSHSTKRTAQVEDYSIDELRNKVLALGHSTKDKRKIEEVLNDIMDYDYWVLVENDPNFNSQAERDISAGYKFYDALGMWLSQFRYSPKIEHLRKLAINYIKERARTLKEKEPENIWVNPPKLSILSQKKVTLSGIAERLNNYLQKFESDPVINKEVETRGGMKLSTFYNARAYVAAGGSKINVVYAAYQGHSSLTREEAQRYLDWLDQGNVGIHFAALRDNEPKLSIRKN